jgi:hypothetical protein
MRNKMGNNWNRLKLIQLKAIFNEVLNERGLDNDMKAIKDALFLIMSTLEEPKSQTCPADTWNRVKAGLLKTR